MTPLHVVQQLQQALHQQKPAFSRNSGTRRSVRPEPVPQDPLKLLQIPEGPAPHCLPIQPAPVRKRSYRSMIATAPARPYSRLHSAHSLHQTWATRMAHRSLPNCSEPRQEPANPEYAGKTEALGKVHALLHTLCHSSHLHLPL
ncbi:hypothetical protein D1872_250250 [compost metagenome]